MKVWRLGPGLPFSHQKGLILCLGQVAQARRPLAAILQDLLPSASSITSSGSHSGKELQSSVSGNEEGFPRASWPPRSPARAHSTSQGLSSDRCREVTRLDWTEQAEGTVLLEARSSQIGRADVSRAGTKWPDLRGAGQTKGRVAKPRPSPAHAPFCKIQRGLRHTELYPAV